MPPGTLSWTVTAQREDWQVDLSTGQAIQGMLVTFTVEKGGSGTVFVATADYSVDKVRAAIEAKARTMNAIAGLSG